MYKLFLGVLFLKCILKPVLSYNPNQSKYYFFEVQNMYIFEPVRKLKTGT